MRGKGGLILSRLKCCLIVSKALNQGITGDSFLFAKGGELKLNLT